MISVNFYLKNKTAKRTSKIYAHIFQGEPNRIKLPIELSISPKRWNSTKQRFRTAHPNAVFDNQYLDIVRNKLIDVYNDKRKSGELPNREDYLDAIELKSTTDTKDFFDYFQDYHDHSKNRNGTDKSEGTKKQIRSAISVLRQFVKLTGMRLSFQKMNRAFFDKFSEFMFEELEYEGNTAGGRIKQLKAMLGWCEEQGYHSNLEFKKWPVIKIEKPVIRHDDDEVKQIRDYPFQVGSRLDKVRDLYVMQMGCGLRISDFQKLGPQNFKKDDIVISTIKVKGKNLEIPMNSLTRPLIAKYEGKLPHISEQKFRDYIKEALKVIGVNEPTEKIKYINNQREVEVLPKYVLCTTHTARKTFVSRCLDAGIPIHTVAAYTGQSEKVIMKHYTGISNKGKKEEMKKLDARNE